MSRRIGDRKDGRRLRDLDGMHVIMPLVYPNRCDNEAYISQQIDLTKTTEYLKRKNSENPEFRYTLFQLVVTAIMKVFTLRPKMNYFIADGKFYEHTDVSASFMIKKHYSDSSEEGISFIHGLPTDTLTEIRAKMQEQITDAKNDVATGTDDAIRIFSRLPMFLSRFIFRIIRMLDRKGRMPASFVERDPYYASVILSNLGSIKLNSGYHHLTNWGTTSCFLTVGERKFRPICDAFGNMSVKETLDVGMIIDERVADGFYFSKSVRMFRRFLENPEYLELPLEQEKLPRSPETEAAAADAIQAVLPTAQS